MKKIFVILGCAAILLSACGKDDSKEQKTAAATTEVSENAAEPEITTEAMVVEDTEEPVAEVTVYEDEFTKKVGGDANKFKKEFKKLSEPQQYYFCSAFAMGAMSVAKPITASAMVNYFLGLGVNKYNVGIDDDTYMAFNAGKNSFLHEELINVILQDKICENLINEATDYAVESKKSVADLDKLGQVEVEKVVKYIQNQ